MSDAYTTQRGLGIACTPRVGAKVVGGQAPLHGIPPPGPGYLAGASPNGVTSVLGVPGSADIRVIYRPAAGAIGDGVLVARTTSAVDGSWRIDGLDPALKFDVICRKAGYNDLIWCQVQPVAISAMTLSGAYTVSADTWSLNGAVTITGGTGPYTVYTDGQVPMGIGFKVVGNTVVPTGVGPLQGANNGAYTWNLTVIDSQYRKTTIACSITGFAAADPYLRQIRSLLHFDGLNGSTSITDNALSPVVWTPSANIALSTDWAFSGNTSLKFSSGHSGMACPVGSACANYGAGDFTLEGIIRPTTAALGAIQCILDFWDTTGVYLNISATGMLYGGVQTVTANYRIDDTVALANATPVHVALVRKAGTIYLFKGGALVGTATLSNPTDSANPIAGQNPTIGYDSSGSRPFIGYMDEIRLTPAARYTAPFTPPAAAFTNPF